MATGAGMGVGAGQGIDLGGDGVTANDASQDVDLGPNLLQNFPRVLEAHLEEMPARFTGELRSAPGTSFTLELFLSEESDPSGHGEGQFSLGSFLVTTDANGVASWEHTVSGELPPGRFVSATATGPEANTSEFSRWIVATGRGLTPHEIVQAILDNIPKELSHDVNMDSEVDAIDVVEKVNNP